MILRVVANPARGLLNRENMTKKESLAAHTPPPPPPAHAAIIVLIVLIVLMVLIVRREIKSKNETQGAYNKE